MIAIAFAVVGIAAVVAVLIGFAMPGEIIGPMVAATVLAGVSLVLSLFRKQQLQRALARIHTAAPVVAEGLIQAPPLEVAQLIGELRRLGFEMIAVTDTRIGAGKPIRTWVMTGDPGTTWIEVGLGRAPMAVFLSQSQTGRFLETTARNGESIDNPKLLARGLTTTLDDALESHRTTLDQWQAASGPARVVLTLDDYLAAEADQRHLTGGMRIASFIERVVDPGIRSWLVSVAIGGAATAALLLHAAR